MLVLTRKKNQTIVIGDNVVVTLLQVKGNSIQLGIEAPRDIRIVRGELEPQPQKQTARESVTASIVANVDASNRRREMPFASSPAHVNGTVIGPKRVALPTSLKSPARFPSVMTQANADAPTAPPLKRYMPATMREVVGNVSV